MSGKKSQLILGACLPGTGHHLAAWRYPTTRADGGLNFPHYWRLAQKAERGKFDMIMVANDMASGCNGHGTDKPNCSMHSHVAYFEPLTLLSALSVVTERIGLVATASTVCNEPYHVARQFASLDHLSDGRAGWNVTTLSPRHKSANHKQQQSAQSACDERTQEFVEVVTNLWDSWDDDAFLRDKRSGAYFDPDKVHILDHQGKHFCVQGPLSIARSPQGHPIIIQSDFSPLTQELAAQSADVIVTTQQTLAGAKTFYSAMKEKLAKYRRHPEDLKVIPGVFVIVGKSEQEARDKYSELQELIDPKSGVALLSNMLGGVDLSPYPLDAPLPSSLGNEIGKDELKRLTDLAGKENRTIRQLYMAMASARGHRIILGTAQQIADQLEDWFVHGAADGFNVMPPYLPGGLDDFVELVIPVLQHRGLFRTEYEGRTLRENLGLRRPANQLDALRKRASA